MTGANPCVGSWGHNPQEANGCLHLSTHKVKFEHNLGENFVFQFKNMVFLIEL